MYSTFKIEFFFFLNNKKDREADGETKGSFAIHHCLKKKGKTMLAIMEVQPEN